MGRDDLVRNAVTVISHVRGAAVDRENAPKWREWFEENTAEVLRSRTTRTSTPAHGCPSTVSLLPRSEHSTWERLSRTLADIDNPYLTASPTTEGN